MAPGLNGSNGAGLVFGPQQHNSGSMGRRLAGSRARQLDRRMGSSPAPQLDGCRRYGYRSMARQLTGLQFNGSSARRLDG